jgi:hypothetical protein
MKKYIITTTAFIISVIAMGVPVCATEDVLPDYDRGYDVYSYSGEIDIFTGLPVGMGLDGEVEETYKISDGSNYSTTSDMYSYPVGEGTFNCSVADGMIVTGSVNMSLTECSNVDVYLDGKKFDYFPETVSEVGSYSVIYWTDNSSVQVMTFKIVNKVTGSLTQFVLPSGFAFKDVLKDGVTYTTGLNTVDLNEEGDYSIGYVCIDNMKEYVLEITVDHTPPAVEFIGVDEDDKAKGPVTVTGIEDTDRVYVYRDGEETHLNYEGKLTESGRYRVVVTDLAGNTVEKNFTILIYLNVKSIVFLAILLVGIIALGIALYVSRKRLRVR